MEKKATWLANFRQFLAYHLSVTKGVLHTRMRKKNEQFLNVLLSAVPEDAEQEVKIFKRLRGTKQHREETKIVHDITDVKN
jgi:hypothetical protein